MHAWLDLQNEQGMKVPQQNIYLGTKSLHSQVLCMNMPDFNQYRLNMHILGYNIQ